MMYNITVVLRNIDNIKRRTTMKRILVLILASIMFVFALASCTDIETGVGTSDGTETGTASGTDNSAASDYEYIKGKGKLVIGITDYKPMNYKETEDGEWTGFDTEFAQKVCEKLGVEAEFIVIDWDNKFPELNSKSIDCIWNGMTISDEVKANTSVTNAYVKNAQVVVMKSDKIGNYGDIDSMKDLTFTAESGSTGADIIKELNYNFVEVVDMATALLEVQTGSSDACVIDITMANAMTGEGTSYADLGIACEVKSEEYGIAFRTGSDMVEKVNGIMAELMNDGTLDALAEKYSLTLIK